MRESSFVFHKNSVKYPSLYRIKMMNVPGYPGMVFLQWICGIGMFRDTHPVLAKNDGLATGINLMEIDYTSAVKMLECIPAISNPSITMNNICDYLNSLKPPAAFGKIPSKLIGAQTSTNLKNECAHQWKNYVGFTHCYDFCEKCDIKRNEKAMK